MKILSFFIIFYLFISPAYSQQDFRNGKVFVEITDVNPHSAQKQLLSNIPKVIDSKNINDLSEFKVLEVGEKSNNNFSLTSFYTTKNLKEIKKQSFPQVDTLYYLPDTAKFVTNYAATSEVYFPHCRFYPSNDWDFYKVKEIHFLFSHMIIGDTLKSIAIFKDTLKTKIYEQVINDILDSADVYPNWYKVIIDTNFTPIQGIVEVPYWLIGPVDFALPTNVSMSGNSIGFYQTGQIWGPIIDRPIKLIIEQSTTEVSPEIQSPNRFILHQNYPNPFNPSTKIKFEISEFAFVTLKVYDLLGREIAVLVDEPKQPGVYEIEFDARKYELSSGVYLYRLSLGSFSATKKFVYLR